MVETIVGCKWSLHVLACVRNGIVRPGAMEKAAPPAGEGRAARP